MTPKSFTIPAYTMLKNAKKFSPQYSYNVWHHVDPYGIPEIFGKSDKSCNILENPKFLPTNLEQHPVLSKNKLGRSPSHPLPASDREQGTRYYMYSTSANKWEFKQMRILWFFLQLFREQMGISAISYQMRLFFTILLQRVREQMGIWLKMLAVKTKMGSHLFASIL